MTELVVRPMRSADNEEVLDMLQPVFAAGDTYAIDTDMSRAETLAYWTGGGHEAFVVEASEDGRTQLLGTYYLCQNHKGGGAHVCNCGFVTAAAARGKGVARTMLEHALKTAPERGFRAMQFNFVVSTNTRAIAIWQSYGFDIAGRLPGAFNHPSHGYVDALVMYKDLTQA
ncbi:GNAT family N-acetyltransferase [Roseibium polysiphoniae]|uniref:GNAT family N-acetyltransferase n=1 Tax=Roseibium polysiphoniae TaxID=2571221 RepID=A0ABR9C997_9HYPH|nr:N-acetyltransferase [Roseibium polysiphoniae]MBD8875645.1 GNAT family N-acetyltransferase [Roseibium polysiphoniae]